MSSKLDVRDIISDHLSTLVDRRTAHRSGIDLTVFFIVPAVAATVMVSSGLRLNGLQTTALITALSVFAALLFNLLLLTHSIVTQSATKQTTHGRELLKQSYANISFAILVSVVAIVLLLTSVLFKNLWVHLVASGLVYFLVINFLLTLFVILKRIHSMLRVEFEGEDGGS